MLLEKLLHLLAGWAPAFCQQRTCERAIALALGLLCGLGRRTVTRSICFNNRQHARAKKLRLPTGSVIRSVHLSTLT
jgi:hypothetical protein